MSNVTEKEKVILIAATFALALFLTFGITRAIYTQPMSWMDYTGEYPLSKNLVLRIIDGDADDFPDIYASPSKEHPLRGSVQIINRNGGKETFTGTFTTYGDGFLVITQGNGKIKGELCFVKNTDKVFYIENGKEPIKTKKTAETSYFL